MNSACPHLDGVGLGPNESSQVSNIAGAINGVPRGPGDSLSSQVPVRGKTAKRGQAPSVAYVLGPGPRSKASDFRTWTDDVCQ